MEHIFDTIVLGLGPAGISCAVYLKRFNMDVLLIGLENSALRNASLIENYYGIPSISGDDLFFKGIDQAKSLGIDVRKEEVLTIEKVNNIKITTNKDTYYAKSLFIGVGKGRNKLTCPNAEEFNGKGVSYCAICDGFFFRNKNIGIVGHKDFMKNELEILKRFNPNVAVFTNGETSDIDTLYQSKIHHLEGDGHLERVVLEDGTSVLIDGLFVAMGSQSSFSIAKHLGLILDDEDNIVVNNYQTNIPGIFAGGDAIEGIKQVIKAANDGALAAMEIKKYLREAAK